jgi:plastocyanin
VSYGRWARALAFVVGLAASWGAPLAAQPLLERTPNFGGTWVPPARTAHFAFLHRFDLVGPEGTRKLINYPTLVVSVGLSASFALGATYASNSELGVGTFNEWELAARRRFGVAPYQAATIVAWNSAAESVDGELTGSARFRRVTLHGAIRAFSRTLGQDDAGAAVGMGAVFHLTPRLALAADVARIVTTDTLPSAWSAGLHLAIPNSPHTLGIVVANMGVATLQGASRGIEDETGDTELRYGFAFTMPLGTLEQWSRIFHGATAASIEGPAVTIRDFAFDPPEIRVPTGATVQWVNEDFVVHSVTSDDGSFDSGLVQPGEGYSRRFDAPGRYPYHCTPHPFMKGVVVVEPS